MKYLVKIFIFSSLLFGALNVQAQVTGVQYAILYNSETQLLNCYIYIDEGKANGIRDRVQFNAQYSLLIPTGAQINIESSFMPLIDNQKFLGIKPVQWNISSSLISPEVIPEFDLYGLTPTLAPAGFYNNLEKGDLVKIFSISIEGDGVDVNQVRLFDNDLDPHSHDKGMKNGDFSNGFTMGGYHQLYTGIKIINQEEANYTSLDKEK